MTSGIGWALAAAATTSLATASVATPVPVEPRAEHSSGLASKKGGAAADRPALLGTLVETHTGDHFALDADSPDEPRFDRMLADRVTGAHEHLDPRLLGLLRTLAAAHSGARIELVSGYRSAKLNEILRKKGHHVASHSQHSLGHAVDFRVVVPGSSGDIPPMSADPLDPRLIEQEIRAGGWTGGTGVYLSETDRFVHADVGPNRRWNGL
jgi:uncharacterized protein YcbK (DUF882 family)